MFEVPKAKHLRRERRRLQRKSHQRRKRHRLQNLQQRRLMLRKHQMATIRFLIGVSCFKVHDSYIKSYYITVNPLGDIREGHI